MARDSTWRRMMEVYDSHGEKRAVASLRPDGLEWTTRSPSMIHRFRAAASVAAVLRGDCLALVLRAFVESYP